MVVANVGVQWDIITAYPMKPGAETDGIVSQTNITVADINGTTLFPWWVNDGLWNVSGYYETAARVKSASAVSPGPLRPGLLHTKREPHWE